MQRDKKTNYKFFLLATIFYLDIRLAALAEDCEWEMLDIRLDLDIIELASNETFGIENTADQE